MGIHSFEILLDTPGHEFTAGSVVSGRVVLQKSGNETTKGIAVSIFGKAETRWRVQTVHYDPNRDHFHHDHFDSDHDNFHHHGDHYVETTSYFGDKTFFQDSRQLFGNGHVKESIPSDNIEFPFSFKLPTGYLLHSLEVESAKVFYGLEAKVNKSSWWSSDKTALQTFVVLPTPLDLNLVPGAELPTSGKEEHRFGKCCKSQPLRISLECPVRGVCADQRIPVTSEIVNFSDTNVSQLKAKLVQSWHLKGSTHYCGPCGGTRGDSNKDHIVIMSEAQRGGVMPGGVISWPFELRVPAHAESSIPIELCDVISLRYEVQIHAEYKECCGGGEVVAVMPIIVGSLPLLSVGKPLSEHNTLFEGAPAGGKRYA